MEQKPAWWYKQSGVIAYRLNSQESSARRTSSPLEVLLITSRKRKRWIIPKGIIEADMSPQASAAKEAFEEAGILGNVSDQAIGTYTHKKWQGTCIVEVFPLEVTKVLDAWPEYGIRQREWMSVDEAVKRVQQEGLKPLIKQLPGIILE
jgi:8-oxo-dGTP pyrophosphatase MutT (NUDIX family)